MIYFYLPEFYYKHDLNTAIIRLLRTNPELFYDDIEIGAVYGCFPGSIWNGGRCMSGWCSKEKMEMTIDEYNNQLHVPLRFTFTNCMLEKDHLKDAYCNMQLKLADNGINEVLVNSDILDEYIRYEKEVSSDNDKLLVPKFHYFGSGENRIISSTTKRLLSKQSVLDELFYEDTHEYRYKLVVLDYIFNNTDDLFESPLPDNADKFELLLNAYCQDECPSRARHYKQLSIQQLEFMENTPDFGGCCHINDDFYDVMETRKAFIKREDLYGKYKDAGYQHFKIEGRTNSVYDVLESYLYYMVKPEYIDKVRLKALKAMEQAARR